MTLTDMNQAIRGYIRELYNVEYNKKLEIERLESGGFKASFYMRNSEFPFVLIADLPEKEFLKYVYNELRKRQLQAHQYFKTIKLYKS